MSTPADKKFQQLSQAISKAINSLETPVKEKHVRSTIIGSFQEQGAVTYWVVASRLPLQDNRIVAWKFCHVTHKLLREGHPACLDDSQRHVGMIENLGKLWVHLREGYGKLINLYTALLAGKLRFHARNPQLPGNMAVTADELDAIAEGDVNNYFQLCVELFDYMDDILNLQAAVFDSLGNARANSMTASGQCRLAALIPCAQDSSHIYDCNVRLLFRLHAALPADTLAGHRERFRLQFKKLSEFYKHASTMQYFRNLLTLPQLPGNPPNFLIQSDFGTYVAPVVMIPEPVDETDAVGSLIDTSDTISVSQMTSADSSELLETRATPSPQPDLVLERDRLIEQLQTELRRQRGELTRALEERAAVAAAGRDHCARLDAELSHAKIQLEEERQKVELMTTQTPEITQKLAAIEERARATDDKFQKLKGAYTQLREEHIGLIRQKAEVDKMAASLRTATAEHESVKVALQQQLNDRSRDMELLQQSASTSDAITNELETLRNEIVTLRTDLAKSREREKELEELKISVEETHQQYKREMTEAKEQVSLIKDQTKQLTELLENTKIEKLEKETELERLREEILVLKVNSGEEFSKVVEEKEAAMQQVAALTMQFQQEKQEMETQLQLKKQSLLESDQRERSYQENIRTLTNDIETQRRELTAFVDSKVNEAIEFNNTVVKLADAQKEKDEMYEKICSKDEEIEVLKDNLKKIEESELLYKSVNQDLQNYLDKYNELDVQFKAVSELLLNSKEEIAGKNVALDTANNEVISLNLSVKEHENNIQKLLSEQKSKDKTYQMDINVKNAEIENLKETLANSLDEKSQEYEKVQQELKLRTTKSNELTFELQSLSEELEDLNSEMVEREAELEITKNELISLKTKFEDYEIQSDKNLTIKIEALRVTQNELNNLVTEKEELLKQISKLNDDLQMNQKDHGEQISRLQSSLEKLRDEYQNIQIETSATIATLTEEIKTVIKDCDEVKCVKETEIQKLKQEFHDVVRKQSEENVIFEQTLVQNRNNIDQLTNKITEISEESAQKDVLLREYEDEKKILEKKFEYSEKERLTAECELQDLLQHNTTLEGSLSALKNELQQTQRELDKQRSALVQCAAAAGAEMLQVALADLERGGGVQESSVAAADLAARALRHLAAPSADQTATATEREAEMARSAVSAAHHAAQLATLTTDLLGTLADTDLVDSVTSETRTMLTLTKRCVEGAARGEGGAAEAEEARTRVAALAARAAAAAAARAPQACVDDELADMDRAIEEAADRIEEMLAASRAADSGVKLEVNSKILDACTTLMGAVRALVRDARRLQGELGDTTARRRLYRRNPQWSEGLISAAKAVVVAAKMLVTSADEAVCGSGAIEGVSAASHEVAGSTAQLVAASRARAPPASPALAALSLASRHVAAATGAVVAAVRAASVLTRDHDDLETSALTLTATRRLEMESKVRSLELESALDAERARLAALHRRHYQLAQQEENGNMTNGGH